MADQDDSTRDVHGRQPEAHVVRLLDEFLNRQAEGETLSEEALLASHPECADELREHLELVRHLQPRQQRIEELLARGVLQPSADGTGPALLDGYHVHGVLGEGGMGVVLDGHDPQLNRYVALKILRPESANDSLALARFEREAKAAGALQHPNVLTIHGIGCDRGVHYIVMERVHGPSLAQVLGARGPLPRILVRDIFRQILEGLAAAHEAGLIHRDIKSSNILLDCGLVGWPTSLDLGHPSTQHFVKIADFGLARMQSSRTQLTLADSILGTPEYMSPEQARGDAEIDHRTDLYSAGVVLYEMLTGRTPFKADTPTTTIRRILDDEPEDPRKRHENTDPHLATLALRLMAKRPEDRVASATEALAAIQTTKRMRLPERRRRLRRRWFATVSVLAVLLVVAWTAWQLTGGRPRISAVRIDEHGHRAIQARYGNDPSWTTVYRFPAHRQGEFIGAGVTHASGRQRRLVVLCTNRPLDERSSVLAAFNGHMRELWRLPLHDDRQWPDVPPPDAYWLARQVVLADLDGDGLDEVIVSAGDPHDYPSRISVVDPGTGNIRATFWHFGQIHKFGLVQDYFADGRPAIVAWGTNNKLDGFDNFVPDEAGLTVHDRVLAVMILDPLDMDGLGPPRANPVEGIATASVVAYAFLGLSVEEDVYPAGISSTRPASRLVRPPAITLVETHPTSGEDRTTPWLSVHTENGARLIVDRTLGLLLVEMTDGATTTPADWERWWKRIIPKTSGGQGK